MKLWAKSLIGLGVIGTVTGATVGGMAAYSKYSPSVKGSAHRSNLSMINDFKGINELSDADKALIDQIKSDFDKKIIKTEQEFDAKVNNIIEKHAFSKLTPHFINAGDNPNSSVAKYVANFDDPTKDVVTYKDKNWKPEEFVKQYILDTGNEPTLVVYAGPVLFEDQYLTVVKANDFVRYVAWFMTQVSWGPDMMSLTSFTVVKGVEKSGSALMEGGHSSIQKEETYIKFYPDVFFGSLPMYSAETGPGNAADRLLIKGNKIPISKQELERLVKSNNEVDEANRGKIRYIQDTGVLPGENGGHGYIVYWDAYDNLIDDLLDEPIYSKMYLKENQQGPYMDDQGNLQFGTHSGISLDQRVSLLHVLNVANTGFKGIGYNFLKYVGAHEYGHHQTLQTASDISETAGLSGGFSAREGISSSILYDKDVLNLYLSARAPELRVAGQTSDKAGDETLSHELRMKYFENGVEETGDPLGVSGDEKIMKGYPASGSKKHFRVIKNPISPSIKTMDPVDGDGRGLMTWDELTAEAKRRGFSSIWPMMIENAFDGRTATLNPGYGGDAMYIDSDQKFVNGQKEVYGIDPATSGVATGTSGVLNTYDESGVKTPLKFQRSAEGMISVVPNNGDDWLIHTKNYVDDNISIWAKLFPDEVINPVTGKEYKPSDVRVVGTTIKMAVDPKTNKKAVVKDLAGNPVMEGVKETCATSVAKILGADLIKVVVTFAGGIGLNGWDPLVSDPDSPTGIAIIEKARSDIRKNGKYEDYKSIFSDYTNIFPEALTRDTVQTEYVPSSEPFDNLPSYLQGISESGTGLEYFIDGKMTSKYVEGMASEKIQWAYLNIIKNFTKEITKIINTVTVDKTDPGYNKAVFDALSTDEAERLFSQFNNAILTYSPGFTTADAVVAFSDFVKGTTAANEFKTVASKYLSEYVEVKGSPSDVLPKGFDSFDALMSDAASDLWTTYIADRMSINMFENPYTYTLEMFSLIANYMGVSQASNNGFSKDRMSKMEMGAQLYNADGSPRYFETDKTKEGYIDPDSIIKTLDGKHHATTYAQAMWLYTLESKGVGARTITGIWRSKDRDAAYMWGYIPTSGATPKYLVFTDKNTGEKKYLPIRTGVDNLHYLTTQSVESTKHTLADEGYTSWISDFASMGDYRDAFLKDGHQYKVDFADEDKEVIDGLFHMNTKDEDGNELGGSRHVIAENGKTPSQAATVLTSENGVSTITVKRQFNI